MTLYLTSFAQCVSIELTVWWKKVDTVYINSESFTSLPYLDITYRNNSDIPLYFLKVSHGKEEYPKYPNMSRVIELLYYDVYLPGITGRPNNDTLIYDDYSGNNYIIELGGTSTWYLGGYWEAVPDSSEDFYINNSLDDIYEYLSNKTNHEKTSPLNKKKKLDFYESEINPDGILKSINDHFVFLDPGETYTDSYNLIGFQLVGGNFTFTVYQDALMDYVFTESYWDDALSKNVYNKAYLPEKVGKYKLFYGNFNSNETTVRFSNNQ